MGGTIFITKTELKKERGWTDSLINEFVSVPDVHYPNPHSKKAGNICLYSIDRIIKIEENSEFRAKNDIISKRKVTAAKVVVTKREKLKQSAAGYKPILPILKYEELKEKAIAHYVMLNNERGKYYVSDELNSASDDFLNRIISNYIRHMLSDYEYKLKSLKGKVGGDESYYIIRDKINQAIKEAYPFLSDEILLQGFNNPFPFKDNLD